MLQFINEILKNLHSIVENDCEHEKLSENENWSIEDEREFNKWIRESNVGYFDEF